MRYKRIVVAGIVLVLGICLLSSYGYAEEEGLIGYWKFDEGKGGLTQDFSGNGNNGRIHGAKWVTGKCGQALGFDGIDDYVDCGNDESLNFGTGDFTLEAWVKITQAPEGTKGFGVVVKGGPTSVDGQYGVFVSTVNITAAMRDDAGFVGTTFEYSLDKFYHVAGVFDRDRYLSLYIDGVLEDNDGISSHSSNDISNNNDLTIGYGTIAGNPGYFKGIIDEVRIYNRALSADEVKALYLQRTEVGDS